MEAVEILSKLRKAMTRFMIDHHEKPNKIFLGYKQMVELVKDYESTFGHIPKEGEPAAILGLPFEVLHNDNYLAVGYVEEVEVNNENN